MRSAMRVVVAMHARNMTDHRVNSTSIEIGGSTLTGFKREGLIIESAFLLERTVEFLDRTLPILYRLN